MDSTAAMPTISQSLLTQRHQLMSFLPAVTSAGFAPPKTERMAKYWTPLTASLAASLVPSGDNEGPSTNGNDAKSSTVRVPGAAGGAAAAGAWARAVNVGNAAAEAASCRKCLRIMLVPQIPGARLPDPRPRRKPLPSLAKHV